MGKGIFSADEENGLYQAINNIKSKEEALLIDKRLLNDRIL